MCKILFHMHLNASIKQPSVNQLASMVQPENIRKYCPTASFGARVYSLFNLCWTFLIDCLLNPCVLLLCQRLAR